MYERFSVDQEHEGHLPLPGTWWGTSNPLSTCSLTLRSSREQNENIDLPCTLTLIMKHRYNAILSH